VHIGKRKEDSRKRRIEKEKGKRKEKRSLKRGS
jgi:hypothetical protein